jgi:hypothetical protein
MRGVGRPRIHRGVRDVDRRTAGRRKIQVARIGRKNLGARVMGRLEFAEFGEVGADRLHYPRLLAGDGGALGKQGASEERHPGGNWDQGTTKNQGHLEWSGKGLERG